MAAMTLNLTGPIEPVEAREQPKPKDSASEPGPAVRPAMAPRQSATATTSVATLAAPASYIVRSGDTVSSIAGRYGLSTASVLAMNGLSWTSLIFPGQQLTLASAVKTAVPAGQEQATPSGRYIVVAGDTVSAIAARFGVSTLSVLTANGLGWSSIIHPGQALAIPGLIGPGTPEPETDPEPQEAPVRDSSAPEPEATGEPAPGETVAEQPVVEEVLDAVPVVDVAPIVEPVAPAPAPAASGSYTIVSGDTISAIATRYGISTQALLDANGLASSSVIHPGQKLVIPGVTTASSGSTTGGTSAGATGNVTPLNDEMRANAALIVRVGRDLGVPDYGIVIALATAMQESTLRNLTWGDRDSVGLFQQRPSAGWGSVEQLTTPEHAARLFYGGPSNPNRGYTRGLLDISGWQSMSLTQAAQKVQISAYPNAYAKWEASAWAWFAELG
jgi:LysM repeat protein